ncbi:MAG: hypothetical protein IJ806_11925 [Ruminococcus sp.]|nr:hypothetical protein [Ruminococcus sp.]
MKKIVSAALAISLAALSLAGCNDTESSSAVSSASERTAAVSSAAADS